VSVLRARARLFLLEQIKELAVAFLPKLVRGGQARGSGVHAVAQAGGRRPVIEQVSRVRVGVSAPDLGADLLCDPALDGV